MNNWSKPLPEEEAASAKLWEVPEFGAPVVDQIEELQAVAYDEGFAQGRKEGQEAGRKEGREAGRKEGYEAGLKEGKAIVERIRGFVQNFSKPLEQLDADVEQMLVELMLKLAKEIAVREFKRDPQAVAGVVREAIRAITPPPREVRVFLHPDDAAALQEAFAQQTTPHCHIMPDPSLQIGDCRVTTDASDVNALLDARVAEIAQSLFGE